MIRNSVLLLVTLLTAFLSSDAGSDVVLRICAKDLLPAINILKLEMDNPKDEVAALQVDVWFDSTCFTVTRVAKTYRSAKMDIFNYSDIEDGIRIAMTGIHHSISPGFGPVAYIITNMNYDCDSYYYYWEVTECIVVDTLNTQITCLEESSFCVDCGYEQICIPHFSNWWDFDLSDVEIGETGIASLTVQNIGNISGNVTIGVTGCAFAIPTGFHLNVDASKNIKVGCSPLDEGPCSGTLRFSGCSLGNYVIDVTCNGVPCANKGNVNGDANINILDVIAVVNHILEIKFLNTNVWCQADCNGDVDIDILDIIGIVNVILELGTCGP